MKLQIAPHYYINKNTVGENSNSTMTFKRHMELVNHVNPISKNQKTYLNNVNHGYHTNAKNGIDEQYTKIMNSSSRNAFQEGYKTKHSFLNMVIDNKWKNTISSTSVNNVLNGTKIHRTTNAINAKAIKDILTKLKRNGNMKNFLITTTGSNVCPRNRNSNANKLKLSVVVDENMATNSPPLVGISTCAKKILITHPKITTKNDINKTKKRNCKNYYA